MRKAFGPGILFAATAIGVSHLVQSTRAGADYGWGIAGIILLANVLKFPFFEFGTRYANVTGRSLIYGYGSKGKGVLITYVIVTVLSMFTVTGAVSIVTAGLVAQLTGIRGDISWLTAGLFILCFLWLAFGRFKVLDRSIKLITGLLFLSTLAAFILAGWEGGFRWEASAQPDFGDRENLLFIVALIGWMPTAVDLSVLNSIWTIEKMGKSEQRPSLRSALTDFHIGYWLSAVSALLFVGLGTMTLYGSNVLLPSGAIGFTGTLIDIYTETLGDGAFYLIAVAATAAMFSTTLSVFDGYGRVAAEIIPHFFRKLRTGYWGAVLIVGLGGWILVTLFQDQLMLLVDVAMIISFAIAPMIGYFNWKLVSSGDFPSAGRPGRIMMIWTLVGWLSLVGLGVLFLTVYFIDGKL